MLRDNPKARQVLYIVAFVAGALALFAPMIPGEFGDQLTTALNSLATLATATATVTALNNLTPAPAEPDEWDEPPPAWPGATEETVDEFVADLRGMKAPRPAGESAVQDLRLQVAGEAATPDIP